MTSPLDLTAHDQHNGWSNRETWTLALWIGSDASAHDICAEAAARGPEVLQQVITQTLDPAHIATLLASGWEPLMWQGSTLLACAADVGSLRRVNWPELAAALLVPNLDGAA